MRTCSAVVAIGTGHGLGNGYGDGYGFGFGPTAPAFWSALACWPSARRRVGLGPPSTTLSGTTTCRSTRTAFWPAPSQRLQRPHPRPSPGPSPKLNPNPRPSPGSRMRLRSRKRPRTRMRLRSRKRPRPRIRLRKRIRIRSYRTGLPARRSAPRGSRTGLGECPLEHCQQRGDDRRALGTMVKTARPSQRLKSRGSRRFGPEWHVRRDD